MSALAFAVFALLCSATGSRAAEVQIGVFGLFAPRQLEVQAVNSQILRVAARGGEVRIEGGQKAACAATNGHVSCDVAGRLVEGPSVEFTGEHSTSQFLLSIPGKIDRRFEGRLQITADGSTLQAIIAMDQETAVASIVAAEIAPDAPLEALKAQGIAARSYLQAGARHDDFDFCDTTHCQFLRERPVATDSAQRSAASTAPLVLTHDGKVIRALYSRSCGGKTRTLREAGMEPAGYPYFTVACDACRRDPETWQTTFARAVIQPVLDHPTEAMRLALVRRAGWSALPSMQFRVESRGDSVTLNGTGIGHGIGLCQRGAESMARSGAGFRAILRYYFPNTELGSAGTLP